MVVENLIFNIKRQGDAAASGVNGLSRAMDRLRSASNNATKHTNKFLSSLKRIAYYRVLRTIIKDISQAFMEGLQNVYQYSKTIDSVISQALDGISGAGLQMKNQLGAALGELIATIQPIIIAIINLITRLADAMSQVFALLGGRSTYHKATESTKDWATAATGAAKAAKEWKNQLMGFDEINRLEEPADRTGGAGGGGADFGNFELADVDIDFGRLQKYIDATKEWLSNLNFDPLIQAWGKLRDAVSDFIDIVDGALYWAYTNVLLPLGKWVIEEAAPASIELLASALNVLNAVLTEYVGPAFQWLWENWLKPIAAWLGSEFILIVRRLTEIFNELSETIRGNKSFKEFWDDLSGSEKILLGLIAGFAVLNIAIFALSHPILTIIGVLAALAAVFDVSLEDVKKFVDGAKEKFNEFKEKASEFFQNLGPNVKQWLADGFVDFLDELHNIIGGPLEKLIEEDIPETLEFFKTVGSDVIGWIRDGLSDFGTELHNIFVQPVLNAIEDINKKVDEFKEFIQEAGDTIKEKIDVVVEWLNTEVVDRVKSASENVQDIFNGITEFLQGTFAGNWSSAWDSVVYIFDGIADTVGGIVDGIIGTINSIADSVRGAIDWINELSVVQSTKAAFRSVGNWFDGLFASGGFPDTGEMFIAREAGPEMIGTIGGRTAVANNNDIVAAIEGGVFNAMSAVMSSSGGGSRGRTEFVFNLNGREFARAIYEDQRQVANERGAKLVSG